MLEYYLLALIAALQGTSARGSAMAGCATATSSSGQLSRSLQAGFALTIDFDHFVGPFVKRSES